VGILALVRQGFSSLVLIKVSEQGKAWGFDSVYLGTLWVRGMSKTDHLFLPREWPEQIREKAVVLRAEVDKDDWEDIIYLLDITIQFIARGGAC